MSFHNEFYFWFGLGIALALFILFKIASKLKIKLLNNFGDINIIKKFSDSIDLNIFTKKSILIIITVFFLFLSLARPQWGNKISKKTGKGLNILVILDVSRSMLTEDIKPNRLMKAKHQISKLADYLKGDRIGLVIFAGTSHLQCPLTVDYGAFRMYLDTVNVNTLPVPGTDLPDALAKAIIAFPGVEKKYKVIILLTDGENHQGNVKEITEKAKDENIIIYTIGIGSPNGDLIPIKDARGNNIGYKKDKSGNPILSKLDEVTLEKIALKTGGKYYQATEKEFELKKVYDDILKMERTKIEGKHFSQKEDRFQWFLFPAVLLLFLEIFIKERKKGV